MIRQNEAIVSDVARNSLESAHGGPRPRSSRVPAGLAPDWPALRQSLTEVIEDLSIARSQAEEDIKSHQALTQEFEQVRNHGRAAFTLF